MLVTDKKKTAGLFPQDPVIIFAPVQILSERIYPQRRILRWQIKFLCRQARMQLWCNLLVFGGFWLRHFNWMVMPTCDFHICCFPSEYSEDIRHMPSRIHSHGSQSNTDWLDSVRCSLFCSDPYKQRFWSPIGIVSIFFRIRCNILQFPNFQLYTYHNYTSPEDRPLQWTGNTFFAEARRWSSSGARKNVSFVLCMPYIVELRDNNALLHSRCVPMI